jgi:hypothetical protein
MGVTIEQPLATEAEDSTSVGFSPMLIMAWESLMYMIGHRTAVTLAKVTPMFPATGTLTQTA